MGWIALRVTRTTTSTGEFLGTQAVLFPKIENEFVFGNDRKNAAQIAQYPDFPIEANVFSTPRTIVTAKNIGFGNVLNIMDYNGETWTLDNGSRITLSYGVTSDGRQRGVANFYYPDGEAAGNWVIDSYDDSNTGDINWLPIWYKDAIGARMSNADVYYRGFYINHISYGDSTDAKIPGSGTAPPRQYDFFEGITPIIESDDPYDGGGRTEQGGGEGDFDNTSDPVDIPDVPTLSATDAKFITLFTPTLAQMQNLASYMWSDVFDVATWKKLFADPMQAILGLSIVPVTVPSSSGRPVTVGNIPTDVSMNVADTQYVTLDCGTLNVNEFWGAYLDYDPYTKAEIYLPYIGTHALATDDIMGKAVHVVYHIDILSGACCAYIKCGDSVLYSFIGQCAASIPITGDNWTNVINGALSIAGAIGSMVATGGMSAPMALGQIASTAVNAMKPTVQKSGGMSGTGGMLGVQTPYLILTRPRQALPLDQSTFTGYPSFITENLADLTGYTEVENIHLENVPATEGELSEIETLLKSGVIF